MFITKRRLGICTTVGLGGLLFAPTAALAATPTASANVAGVVRIQDGGIHIGDGRPSEPADMHSTEKNPPPNRRDTTAVPRFGVDIDPANQKVQWSYDWRSPVDTNTVSSIASVPQTRFSKSAVPGNLGVVDNHAYYLEQDNRTADGPRKDTTPNDPKWNLTTTDIMLPGFGRAMRVDMVCPSHSGMSHGFDGTYNGYTSIDLKERRTVESYQWGDMTFNNVFVYFHYLFYTLSNG